MNDFMTGSGTRFLKCSKHKKITYLVFSWCGTADHAHLPPLIFATLEICGSWFSGNLCKARWLCTCEALLLGWHSRRIVYARCTCSFQFLALYWKFVHTSLFVCFGLLHLDFFALPQKCVVPPHTSAFSVDLTSAVRDPMGVHWSCVACVGLLHGWCFLRQATGASVSDLCSYAHFFGFGLFWLCVCVYVHEEAAFSGSCVLLLGSIYAPSTNINKFTDFSNEQIDLKPSLVWSSCALPAEKRGGWVVS